MNALWMIAGYLLWMAIIIFVTLKARDKAWRRFLDKDSREIMAPDGLTFKGKKYLAGYTESYFAKTGGRGIDPYYPQSDMLPDDDFESPDGPRAYTR